MNRRPDDPISISLLSPVTCSLYSVPCNAENCSRCLLHRRGDRKPDPGKRTRRQSCSSNSLVIQRDLLGHHPLEMGVFEQFKPSPLVPVFENGFQEFRRGQSITAVQRATQIASSEELSRLERRLPWLATTGAVTPFIGLFGTVWGIIDAFHGLGTAGAATLRAVAPGISEALITTAAGLFAAI